MGEKQDDDAEELYIDGHHYTLSSGTADDVRKAIANGTFSGFRSGAELRAEMEAKGMVRNPDGSVDWEKYFANKRKAAGSPPKPE